MARRRDWEMRCLFGREFIVGLGVASLVPAARAWKWSRQMELLTVPRPTGNSKVHSAGLTADRVLLIGSGMAVGWGVTSHDVGLGGALARTLTARTGHAVDLDIIADPGMVPAAALRLSRSLNLQRYDGVVVTVGVNAALDMTQPSRWRRDLGELVTGLEEETRPDTRIFVVGIQPIRSIPTYDDAFGGIVNLHASRLNSISARVCSTSGRATFVPTSAPPPAAPQRFRDGSTYRYWADEIGAIVAPEMDRSREVRAAEFPSAGLESATPEYGVMSRESEIRLDSIVKQALTMLGGAGAAFGLIEDSRIVVKARAGTVPGQVDLAGSFTAATFASRGALIVPDAAADERFRSNPNVVGDLGIRQWAGFPVESASGNRVGVICVFGPRPKAGDPRMVELVLRQLALQIQDVLRTV
ncbi:MAG: hypothetical protein QOF79_3095 [Actinomycetota bacterium]|nr:hypothetical protein [Actinomycetota bacterium]